MSQVAVTRTIVEGFETLQVDTGALALAIVPELGAKISSLRDTRSNREWLWRHPRMPYQRVPHGSSYVQLADTGGWDECFPSVSACAYPSEPWAGAAVQDHGELWSQAPAFALVEDTNTVSLRAEWRGVALPYTFTRAITATRGSARLRFEYAVVNNADSPLDFIWSAHPLIAIEPGMRLMLPEQARFHSTQIFRDAPPRFDRDVRFPLTVQSANGPIDLAALPERSASVAIKLWSEPCEAGWATLRASDGELRMQWDAALLPQIAVWMNLGAAAFDGGEPYFNMGLEPCMGAQDSLEDAVKTYRLFEQLPPRGSRAWWLEVELAA